MLVICTKKDLNELRKLVSKGSKRQVQAFRLARPDGRSYYFPAMYPRLHTRKGVKLRVRSPCTDHSRLCGAGVNVATQRWCKKHTEWAYSLMVWRVQFRVSDVACIPWRSDGKFRLYRCTVLRSEKRPPRVTVRL